MITYEMCIIYQLNIKTLNTVLKKRKSKYQIKHSPQYNNVLV